MNVSLRTRLAVALALAALLPLLIVSAVGARVALERLERSLKSQTREAARIALNLLLRKIQSISEETDRLASDPELHELVALEPALVPRLLKSRADLKFSGLVEVVLRDRTVAGRAVVQRKTELMELRCQSESSALEKSLNYESYISVERLGEQLVIRAAAPIVDTMFKLRGAVVTTLPLDEQMADFIRGVVQADIGFLVGQTPVASTFVDHQGLRIDGVHAPDRLAQQVLRGRTELTIRTVAGRQYDIAFSPLQTVQGRRVGMLSVGISREGLLKAKASAYRSLFFGALGGLIFALVVAYVVGRRITIPISRLHRGTQAIAEGNWELELPTEADDEIGDLARAFSKMTVALHEHQQRLAARVREISTLHQIGRAVSSVISLDQVLHMVVTEVVGVVGVEKGGLMLAEGEELNLHAEVGLPVVEGKAVLPPQWRRMARAAVDQHGAVVEGTVLAVPLETREAALGALLVARREGAGSFSEGDLRLVVTFCDQASSAIENARLYEEVRSFSEDLERTVGQRTAQLRMTNEELQQALRELKEAQFQLVHSEKMAVLGTLVAGIAHEINTPAGAIQGALQMMDETLGRMVTRTRTYMESGLSPEDSARFLDGVARMRTAQMDTKSLSPIQLRHRAKEAAETLAAYNVQDARRLARRLVEAGGGNLVPIVAQLSAKVDAYLLVGIVEDLVFLERSARTMQASIRAIVRLVGTLRTYVHTDQEAITEVDITEGIETTLTILHNELRYGINVKRRYGETPKVPVYVDQLNQVWTNLIQNSAQAMNGEGEIVIETFQEKDSIGVRISDTGPGIAEEILPRIFEPFFTTKPRGQGTGLGLSIVQTIIDQHGGQISFDSQPGSTTFTVLLPRKGPPGIDEGSP